jgi:hypothetical protein
MHTSLQPNNRLFYWKVAVDDRWDDIRIFLQTRIIGCPEWAVTWSNNPTGATARQD